MENWLKRREKKKKKLKKEMGEWKKGMWKD